MSNPAYIDVVERKSKTTGQTDTVIEVWDDYGESSVWPDTIPEDDLDLLRLVRDKGDETVAAVLDYAEANDKGITIRGNYRNDEAVKAILQWDDAEAAPAA